MLSGQDGILTKAQEAKNASNVQSSLEEVQMITMTALTEENGNIKSEKSLKLLNDELKKIGYEGNNIKDFPADIEIDGKHYAIGSDGKVKIATWYYVDGQKNTITNGKIVLKVGELITNYNSGIDKNGNVVTEEYTSLKQYNGYEDKTFMATSYTGNWAVLGVEEGQILIMPVSNVNDEYYYLGYNISMDKTAEIRIRNSQIAYENVENELEKISAIYGYGKGADRARSIKTSDINKVTGYNNPAAMYSGGTIITYGREITYKINNDNYVGCNWYKGNTLKEETSTNKTCVYYDGNSWKRLGVGETVTIKAGYYWYYPQTLSTVNDPTSTKGISTDSNEYKLLFKDAEYWVGNAFVRGTEGSINYGVFKVSGSTVRGVEFFNSINYYNNSDPLRKWYTSSSLFS